MELLLPFFIFASYINSLENILSCKRTFIHDTLIIEEQHIGNLGNPKKIYFRVDDKLTKFTSVNMKRSKFSDQKKFFKILLNAMDINSNEVLFNENKNINVNNNFFVRESLPNNIYTDNLVKIGVRLDMHKLTELLFKYSQTITVDGRTILKNPPDHEIKDLTLDEVQSLIEPKHEDFVNGLTYLFDKNTFKLNFYKSNNPDNATLVLASYSCGLVKRKL